jgi:hypothetical protein
MPIHHLLLCDRGGKVLVERFFRTAEDSMEFAGDHGENNKDEWQREMADWRKKTFQLMRPTWREAFAGTYQVATVGERYVVYVGAGNVLFSITGSDDCDELGLKEVLETVIEVVCEICFGKKILGKELDEDVLLKNFGKVCVGLESIIADGTVDNLNVELVLLQTKLKDISKFERTFKSGLGKK